MGFISSYFRSMKNLPKEAKQKEEEEPYTSYSHQQDKEISKKKASYFGEKKVDKLTNILPKYVHNMHEDFKKIQREMYGESPRGFGLKQLLDFHMKSVSMQPHTMMTSTVICPTVT